MLRSQSLTEEHGAGHGTEPLEKPGLTGNSGSCVRSTVLSRPKHDRSSRRSKVKARRGTSGRKSVGRKKNDTPTLLFSALSPKQEPQKYQKRLPVTYAAADEIVRNSCWAVLGFWWKCRWHFPLIFLQNRPEIAEQIFGELWGDLGPVLPEFFSGPLHSLL